MPDRSPTLVLFDVDGTLVRTEGPSPHSRAFRAAFEMVFERECRFLPGMHGMTDLQIFVTLARNLGLEDGRLQDLARKACRTMLEIHRVKTETDGYYVALPGARDTLDTLSRQRMLLGLVTGNDPEIARDKLTSAGLAHYFSSGAGAGVRRSPHLDPLPKGEGDVGDPLPLGEGETPPSRAGKGAGGLGQPPRRHADPLPLREGGSGQHRLAMAPDGWHGVLGAFGTEAEDRSALPPLAVARAEALIGTPIQRSRIFVVGDTPRDVACALDNGCRAVAVATGHCSAEDLLAAGAELVLPSLLELGPLLRLLQVSSPGST